jgi:hypothetical protein
VGETVTAPFDSQEDTGPHVLSFRVGMSNREFLIVRPSPREHPVAQHFDDANWIDATLEIA